jgi:2-hydroxychromene-2-carboxylate isomerase
MSWRTEPDAFYFDLASPLAYLAAERVLSALPGPAEWRPVLTREIPGAESFEAFRCENEEQVFRGELARRTRDLGLQPLVWPRPFPFDSDLAMRVATYSKQIGRVVPFAQAAFRQAYAAGHNLEDPDRVVIAGAACEMHPRAVLAAADLRSVREELSEATARAVEQGITEIPALLIGGRVFEGERALEDALAVHLSR